MNYRNTHMMGPYELHYYRLGEPIREVVRRGQELIYRLVLSRNAQSFRQEQKNRGDRIISALRYGDARCGMKPSYPQSIGELCIELAHAGILRSAMVAGPDYFPPRIWKNAGDIQWLRTKLYHKETK